MKTNAIGISWKGGDGHIRPPSSLLRWGAMVLCLFLVWLFIFVVAPWMQKSQYVEPLAAYINENNIDASALYYTEIEEASIAELNMRTTMEYAPRGE